MASLELDDPWPAPCRCGTRRPTLP